MSDAKTVRVEITVYVDPDGRWYAEEEFGPDIDGRGVPYDEEDCSFTVVADVPVPAKKQPARIAATSVAPTPDAEPGGES